MDNEDLLYQTFERVDDLENALEELKARLEETERRCERLELVAQRFIDELETLKGRITQEAP
jgi:chaperonin cofactor prefoldin